MLPSWQRRPDVVGTRKAKESQMFDALPLPVLLLIFVGAAAAVWIAGVKLSDTTDVLSKRLGLGQALGGLILLSIATNLPELAITVSAALAGNLGIAIGNILGGIAIQTVVLVALDRFGVRGERSLSYQAASLVTVLEGILVAAVLTVAIMGKQLPSSLIVARIAPGGLLIATLWIVGLWLVGKARTDLPWQAQGDAPGGQERQGQAQGHQKQQANDQGHSTARTALAFAGAALVTLVAGVLLEKSGDQIANHIGLSGVLFGATILAASTAIPELATGLTSVKLGDYQLAFSDIFGGNAFLPVLFLVASLLSGQAVLPQAQTTDIYLAGLGILLTTVYLYGLIFRPRRLVLGMGIDSLVVLILYAAGIVGLFAVAHG
jgi:cation:H+ antiporter